MLLRWISRWVSQIHVEMFQFSAGLSRMYHSVAYGSYGKRLVVIKRGNCHRLVNNDGRRTVTYVKCRPIGSITTMLCWQYKIPIALLWMWRTEGSSHHIQSLRKTSHINNKSHGFVKHFIRRVRLFLYTPLHRNGLMMTASSLLNDENKKNKHRNTQDQITCYLAFIK